MLKPTATEELNTVTFTIVYDNNAYDAGLRTSWGFSCWVETGETTILFDTGGEGPTLMHNLRALGLDPQRIDVVVLSHAHGDHTGGLGALLDGGVQATVYAPTSFPESFKTDVGVRTGLVEVAEAMPIAPGITTTGEVGSTTVEQALAVETQEGLVVVTGCAHPGVVQMVRRAKEAADGEVALVMGGFHLGGASLSQIERIMTDLRDLGVKRVAPCHCTGDKARHAFVDAFGEDAVLAGVGWSTEFVRER
jgi:7,8-dihydropterin-6-yl-methyl-4-(beta-D-ribofuranosyl)aminobenzene 5'-phosphate synthase